jgi:hypothetical protein
MKLRNTILAFSALIGAQAFGMEAPPQKPTEYPMNTLLGLPPDIKNYLLPFVVHGNVNELEKNIFTLAATNKAFFKSRATMLDLLNWILKTAPYEAHAVDLAQRLQKKPAAIPVMQDSGIVSWITKVKANLEFCNGFFIAVKANQIEDVKNNYLMNRKTNLNGLSPLDEGVNMTPLMYATQHAHAEMVELLLSAGANPNMRDGRGCMALIRFGLNTSPETISKLIKAGANPNIPADNGNTPLIMAVFNTRADLVKVLLEGGADPEIVGQRDMTALDWAERKADGFCTHDVREKHDAILAMLGEAIAKKIERLVLKSKQQVKS